MPVIAADALIRKLKLAAALMILVSVLVNNPRKNCQYFLMWGQLSSICFHAQGYTTNSVQAG